MELRGQELWAGAAAANPPFVVSPEVGQGEVTGQVCRTDGTPATTLQLRLYHIGYRGRPLRLSEGLTGEDGQYRLRYEHRGPANLEVRALDLAGTEVALSRTKYAATPAEVLNLVAPANVSPLRAEYRRLIDDLTIHIGDEDLADAEEQDGRGDVTMLGHMSGWDSRLVGHAAAAAKLARQTGVEAGALYGLLRVGLPADGPRVASLTPQTWDAAFARASADGLIDLSDAQIQAAKSALRAFRRSYRRSNPTVPGTLSTVGQLLAISGLSEPEQDTFDEIVMDHQGDDEQLWEKVKAAGISDAKIAALRVQGQLGYLTLNSARLIAALHEEIAATSQLDQHLVTRDLYRADSWRDYLQQLAGGNETALAAMIPPAYTADTVDDRVAAYAQDMARKVRQALPTKVMIRRIEAGELRLGAAAEHVATALKKADGLGFRFGAMAAGPFVREYPQIFAGLSEEDAKSAARGLMTLQRLYQVTPSDDAMQALLDAGITSARQITSYDPEAFVRRYADRVGGPEIARLIVGRAERVCAVTLSAVGAAGSLQSAPPTYAYSSSDGEGSTK